MTYNDLGCWANMRLAFIKQYRPQPYQSQLKENKLNSYLAEFVRQVRDTMIQTEEQMRQSEGITEELKRQDQLEWVCRMNNIRSRAEEIVTAELIYEYKTSRREIKRTFSCCFCDSALRICAE